MSTSSLAEPVKIKTHALLGADDTLGAEDTLEAKDKALLIKLFSVKFTFEVVKMTMMLLSLVPFTV